jgi:uncharacterized protein (DUF362 family)
MAAVHLAIMDGVKTMAGAQTPDPWCTPVEPGVLIAGTNVVNTAAVAVAAMNCDPRAPKGTVPFERCDNKLLLAEQLGVGSADPNRDQRVAAGWSRAGSTYTPPASSSRSISRRSPDPWR